MREERYDEGRRFRLQPSPGRVDDNQESRHNQLPSYETPWRESFARSSEAIRHQAEQRLDDYEKKLADVHRRLAGLQNKEHEPTDRSRSPPLTHRITEEVIPSRFRIPQIDPYDGISDPRDHMENYKALMMIQGASDALLCLAFLTTLRKMARAWYSGLEPRSIQSFRQLEKMFITYFNTSRRMPKESDSLFSIRQ